MGWDRDNAALVRTGGVTLAVAAALALAGCGGGGGAPSQQQIQQQVSSAQQAASSVSNLLKSAGAQARQQLSAAQQLQSALQQGQSALQQAQSAESKAFAAAQGARERQWLVDHGIRGSAVVLAVRNTGVTDTGPTVLAVTGSYGAVEYVLRLRVTVSGKPAYTTSVDQPVASDVAAGLHTGAVIPVKADPRHLAYVLVG